MPSVIMLIQICSAFLAVLMAIGQIMQHKQQSPMLFIIFMCLSISQIRALTNGFITIDKSIVIPVPYLTVMIFAGIAIYLYFIILSQPEISLEIKNYYLFLLLIPAVLIDACIVLNYIKFISIPHIEVFLLLTHIIGAIALLSFILRGFIKLFSIFSIQKLPLNASIIFGIFLFSFLSIIIGLLSLALSLDILLQIMSILFFILLIAIYLISQINPDILLKFEEEIHQSPKRKSLIQGLDKEKIETQLHQLMSDSKAYKKETCSLNYIAGMIKLSPHQLSEFLNKELSVNFRTFINQYRIIEAKDKLISNKELTILEIAFECGFNNKTSFNEAFLRFTGLTPTAFRKKIKTIPG